MTSRIWDLGYKNGYMNSVLASLGLCNLKTPMARYSNYELKVDRIAGWGIAIPNADRESSESRLRDLAAVGSG